MESRLVNPISLVGGQSCFVGGVGGGWVNSNGFVTRGQSPFALVDVWDFPTSSLAGLVLRVAHYLYRWSPDPSSY